VHREAFWGRWEGDDGQAGRKVGRLAGWQEGMACVFEICVVRTSLTSPPPPPPPLPAL
jgi:hypothetical protein